MVHLFSNIAQIKKNQNHGRAFNGLDKIHIKFEIKS
jgi:hypothetical protein